MTVASGVWRASRGDGWWALLLGFCIGGMVMFLITRAALKDRRTE